MRETLRSRRVLTDEGLRPATVAIADGRIRAVTAWSDGDGGEDLGDAVLMPGLVDSHVHVNEPGRTHWEGYRTATRAAAAGGVSTLIDMPLNSVPATTDVAGLDAKLAAAAGKCHVDVGFWAGAVRDNLDQLAALHAAGVMGFKCFLVESGVDEFTHLDPAALDRVMAELARIGALLIVHAELPGPIAAATAALPELAADDYRSWLYSRPPSSEDDAVELLVELCRRHRTRTHVVHLSSAGALGSLRRAKAEGLPLSAETCPHYLALDAEHIAAGATEFKCAPPIRERENQDRLWEALDEGLLELIVTDHSPSPPELKCRDTGAFPCAWGGISSLELGLRVVWTEHARRGGAPEDLARWMSAGPAALIGWGHRKGRVAPGWDADLVAWDPEAEAVVDPARLSHRHPLTPYAHRTLRGEVLATWVRGRQVYNRGAFVGEPGGACLHREDRWPDAR